MGKMSISESNQPFSKGLALLIKTKGLRQVYVAEKSGYTSQELSDMLNGRKLIKACDIHKLAKVLGVTVEEIYTAGKKRSN